MLSYEQIDNDNNYSNDKNIFSQVEAPFVAYGDFECLLKSVNQPVGQHSMKTNEHQPCSYSYFIVSRVPGVEFQPKLYVGTDAAEHFLSSLQNDLYTEIMPLIKRDVDIIWDQDARRRYENATDCYICKKPLNREQNTICADHCHFTGRFRGAVHQSCNLRYKVEKERYKLPVLFHNLRGYDSHLIMQAVRKHHGRIDVIPNNYERYLSFTIGRLKFLDSFQFLPASLDSLAQQMKDSDFKYMTRFFPDPTKRALMLRKGVFPYDYMTSMDKFDETQLPPQSAFYNRLTDEPISDEDYEFAQQVWTLCECRTLRDYHDLYLKSDVFLTTDIGEKFRDDSQALYGLEPVHYYSLPGLSWDAALKHSEVELELITDIDMYLMIEKGIRGGISMISHRYAKANDPRMGDEYDASKPTSTLLYLDANSLYPTAMCEPLPIDQFSMVDNLDAFDVTQVADDAEYGYVLEIDANIPDRLHGKFNDYPLAPEKIRVTPDMLSPFQHQHFPTNKSTEKLVPHLGRLEKYVVHYRNLKLYIQLGLEVTKIHRVVRFRQGAWLKSFMELNIEQRREAARNGDKARVGRYQYNLHLDFD